jgi:hypothetical protein
VGVCVKVAVVVAVIVSVEVAVHVGERVSASDGVESEKKVVPEEMYAAITADNRLPTRPMIATTKFNRSPRLLDDFIGNNSEISPS